MPLLRRSRAAIGLGLAFSLSAFAQSPQQSPAAQQPRPPTPLVVQQSVTVTADRGIDSPDSATTSVTLSPQQMQQEPGLTLDDSLHQVAGFMLYRRTSSWTANPTTEGVSLRGLGSTAASRTLVISDQVPQNDPFGGWVHWDEIPTLDIANVGILLGGSSDLYGSSAMGGVIDIVPVTPGTGASTGSFGLAVDASGATENSANQDALLYGTTHRVDLLGAFSHFATDGYIPTAPALRGTVDIPANVAGESGRVELRTPPSSAGSSAFLRGNLLNEVRDNGTPLQTNAARLWRYQSGGDLHTQHTQSSLRLYGSREDYRQTFTSVPANRNSETPTKYQRVPSDELGLSAQTDRTFTPQAIAALGLDIRDIRGTDNETVAATKVTTSISARQRDVGGFADALWQPKGWLISGSIRVDSFRTFSSRQIVSSTGVVTNPPEIDELFAGPHLGIVRNLGPNAALTANAFRAFRGPTLNELYRTSQVGSQITLANNTLLAERATGFELGALTTFGRLITLRPSFFWTEVNRPISAIQISQTPAPPAPAVTQTLQRENLGQIRSRGLSIEAQSETRHHLSATLGYQLAFATVTAFNAASVEQANLIGKWTPEVPREAVTATAHYDAPHIAAFSIVASYTGEAFDDALNQYILRPYARFDVSANRNVGHGLSVFAGAQNLLNRTIDAGLTPLLTLAPPRLVQGGLRYSFRQ